MERNMNVRLIEWKNKKNKKPLIIKGARQVGKTYTIRKFAKENYSKLVEINFERDLAFAELFKRTRNPKEILTYLQLSFLDVEFNNDTLLFLDEIQACSEALTALKFLGEDFPSDIICSGSMLGVAIANSTSFPVGYVETWTMYPMNFREFLKALNVREQFINVVQECITLKKQIPEVIHQRFNELFVSYIVVGGMPEAVKSYRDTLSYKDSLLVQRRIVSDYYSDMAKYALSSDRIKTRECFESIPLQLAKENKKFQYKLIKSGGSARHYESSLRWLKDSGLIIPVHRLKAIESPLEVYKELSIFKVYFFDTGLLISQFDENIIKELIMGELGVYKGAIYENITAQILYSKDIRFYYYEPSTTSEIDYIINKDGVITPLEVKSGNNTRSVSFNHFIEKYNIDKGIRLSKRNISVKEHIEDYPLYTLEWIL